MTFEDYIIYVGHAVTEQNKTVQKQKIKDAANNRDMNVLKHLRE